jgi:hypothetical protein
MKIQIKKLECILDYQQTKLEKRLEKGLKKAGIELGAPFHNRDYQEFNISRVYNGKKFRLELRRTLKGYEKAKSANYIDDIPRLNRIPLINNPDHFNEILEMAYCKNMKKPGGLPQELSFTIKKDRITEFNDAGDYNIDLLNFISEKYHEKDVLYYDEKKNSWMKAVDFICRAVKNYDSFVKTLG